MRISARAVVKDTLRSMRDNKRLMAFLAVPLTVTMVILGLIKQLPHPAAPLLVLPALPLFLWFALPLMVNIYRSLLEGQEREAFGIGSLFRVGRRELMLVAIFLITAVPFLIGSAIYGIGAALQSVPMLALAIQFLIGGVVVGLRMQPGIVAAGLGRPAPWAVGWQMSRGSVWGIVKTLLLSGVLMLAVTVPFILIYGATVLGMAALESTPTVVALMILGSIMEGLLNSLVTIFHITLGAMLYRHLSAGAEPVVDTPMPDLSPAPVAS